MIFQLIDELGIVSYDWIKPPFEEGIQEKAQAILEINGDMDLAMAFRFPLLRPAMSRIIIRRTGVQNILLRLLLRSPPVSR